MLPFRLFPFLVIAIYGLHLLITSSRAYIEHHYVRISQYLRRCIAGVPPLVIGILDDPAVLQIIYKTVFKTDPSEVVLSADHTEHFQVVSLASLATHSELQAELHCSSVKPRPGYSDPSVPELDQFIWIDYYYRGHRYVSYFEGDKFVVQHYEFFLLQTSRTDYGSCSHPAVLHCIILTFLASQC